MSRRECPVCKRVCGSHREPVGDARGEIVVFHPHLDGVRLRCRMSGRAAALSAVAFTLTAA